MLRVDLKAEKVAAEFMLLFLGDNSRGLHVPPSSFLCLALRVHHPGFSLLFDLSDATSATSLRSRGTEACWGGGEAPEALFLRFAQLAVASQ